MKLRDHFVALLRDVININPHRLERYRAHLSWLPEVTRMAHAIPPSEDAPVWGPRTLLGRLSPAVRAELTVLGSRRVFRAGAVLMDEGTDQRHALLLLRGYVRVTRGAGQVLLTIRGAGDLIGDLAAMSNLPRSATVTACTPITARFILPATLREFIGRHPAAGGVINALVVEQLNGANRRRVEFATQPVPQRLAGVILELADICVEAVPGGRVRLPAWFRQADLGDLVGASEDTVQRGLRVLRAQGMIETGYRSITILDRDLLAAYRDLPKPPHADAAPSDPSDLA